MVSGEVIWYCSKVQRSLSLVANVEPRIVFETRLLQRFNSHTDLLATAEYFQNNSNYLRSMLKVRGMMTRFNEGSFITLTEQLPTWMVQDFHLAPEGDWVHYITMPHISSAVVDYFSTVLRRIEPDLDYALGLPVTLKRTRSVDNLLFPKIITFVEQNGNKIGLGREIRSLCLDSFHRQYINGAMCFAALNSYGNPVVIFLVKSTAQRTLCMGPVLVHAEISCDISLIQGFAFKGLMLLSELLELDLVEQRTDAVNGNVQIEWGVCEAEHCPVYGKLTSCDFGALVICIDQLHISQCNTNCCTFLDCIAIIPN